MFAWLAAVCSATPMWVEPDRVESVGVALAELWPGAPLELRSGPPTPGEGVVWEGTVLIITHDGAVWTADAPDARTAVLITRSRLAPDTDEPAWIPPLPPPAPTPPEIRTVRDSPAWVALGAQLPFTLYLTPGLRGTLGVTVGGGFDLAVAAGWSPRRWRLPIARFGSSNQVTPLERFAGDVYGTWNLGRTAARGPVEPILLAGVEGRWVELVRVGTTLPSVDARFEAGPVIGVGMEVPSPVGVAWRVVVAGRVHWGGMHPFEFPHEPSFVTPTWIVESSLGR